MKLISLALAASLAALASAPPQQTPKSVTATYASLADTILAVKRTEANFVRSLLDVHFGAAQAAYEAGNAEQAAAEIALFANEGDNAIGGVRKRLLEGGHHHNAAGEAKGIFEPGYVVVTRKAKEEALAASAAMRAAKNDSERKQAWERFTAVATPLIREA